MHASDMACVHVQRCHQGPSNKGESNKSVQCDKLADALPGLAHASFLEALSTVLLGMQHIHHSVYGVSLTDCW